MEVYKKLCERRIIELDPSHPLPVMPYHLGQPPSGSPGATGPNPPDTGHASVQSSAELKKLLAVKEQDLYYTKREADRLLKELEQLRSQTG